MDSMISTNLKSKNNRVFYLDLIRITACLFVVLIHVTDGFLSDASRTTDFYSSTIINSISHAGVPLFVMISGALMLDSNYNYSKTKIVNHIKKMGLFFLMWVAAYVFVFQILIPLATHTAIDAKNILVSVISGHGHFWFVFMIIGLYLLVPVLRLWVKKENMASVRYFIILGFVFTMLLPQIIDTLSEFFPVMTSFKIISFMNLKYVSGYSLYFILGWYLNQIHYKNKKIAYIIGIAGAIISVVGTVIFTSYNKSATLYYDNFYINIFMIAIAVFVAFKDVDTSKAWLRKSVYQFSKYTLGIYAVHFAVIVFLERIVDFNSAVINIPVRFVIVTLVSAIASWVMSKIPVLRKIVM